MPTSNSNNELPIYGSPVDILEIETTIDNQSKSVIILIQFETGDGAKVTEEWRFARKDMVGFSSSEDYNMMQRRHLLFYEFLRNKGTLVNARIDISQQNRRVNYESRLGGTRSFDVTSGEMFDEDGNSIGRRVSDEEEIDPRVRLRPRGNANSTNNAPIKERSSKKEKEEDIESINFEAKDYNNLDL